VGAIAKTTAKWSDITATVAIDILRCRTSLYSPIIERVWYYSVLINTSQSYLRGHWDKEKKPLFQCSWGSLNKPTEEYSHALKSFSSFGTISFYRILLHPRLKILIKITNIWMMEAVNTHFPLKKSPARLTKRRDSTEEHGAWIRFHLIMNIEGCVA
jgi:hypothetical protein